MTRLILGYLAAQLPLGILVGRFLAAADRRHNAHLTDRARVYLAGPAGDDLVVPGVVETRRQLRAQLIDDLAGDFAREVDFRLDDVVREWSR